MIDKINRMNFKPYNFTIQTAPDAPNKGELTSENFNYRRSRGGYLRNQYGNLMKD